MFYKSFHLDLLLNRPSNAVSHSHPFDLDEDSFGQSNNSITNSCRVLSCLKIRSIDLIHLHKIVQVRQQNSHLRNIAHRRISSFNCTLQIPHSLVSLPLYVILIHISRLRIDRDLPRYEYHVSDCCHRRVRT